MTATGNARAAPRRHFGAAAAGVISVIAVLLGMPAAALDQQCSIAQFNHSAWTVKEGAPGQVTALAQSADGYLWLGTQTGLFRFDGVTIERYMPERGEDFPATSVSALYAPASGGLWVGFRYGAASFMDADGVTHYGEEQGLPTGSVYDFATDGDGNIWAATFQGPVQLRQHHWYAPEAAAGYPGGPARSLFRDRDDQLWVATEDTLALMPRAAQQFRVVARGLGRIGQIAQAPDGSMWIAETDGVARPVPLLGGPVLAPGVAHASGGLLFDRHGSLWVTTLGEGLQRIAQPLQPSGGAPAVQQFRERQGLSGDYLGAIIEDREGNIWTGSSRGLDRFRQGNLIPAELPHGAVDFMLVPGEAGAIWVGTRNRPLLRLPDPAPGAGADLPTGITAALRQPDGMIWLAGPQGIWRLRGERVELATRLPDAIDHSGVQALMVDGVGALWVSLNRPGIFRWHAASWEHIVDHPAMAEGSSPLSLLADSRGRLWMGFARGELTRVDGDDWRLYTAADGLAVGNITALLESADRLWIGGERGLAQWTDEGSFQMLQAAEPGALVGISGLVASGGELWLNAASGVIRIDAEELRRVRADPGHRIAITRFDFLDGLPGTPAQFRPIPTAVAGSDGRLWFATTGGVVAVDPARIEHNPLAPPVTLRALWVNGERVPAGADLKLPALTRSLQFNYAALSLAIPQRVRYRYRLEGFDGDWQEAGTRREAYYTNLGPGDYRFRVIASNNDGVWNEQGTSVQLSIAPAFFQTTWFAALGVLGGLGVAWLLYLLRLRRLGLHIRTRLHERHLERERIARELHDTLLQSIQGLILRFQAVAESIPAQAPARLAIESALDRADEVLAEGRDRVIDLRASSAYEGELPETFAKVAEELALEHPATFRLVSTGVEQPIDPIVRDEIFRIGREALVNAYRHANASSVDVEIAHGREELRLRFIDDGRGIDASVVKAGGRPGHWGLSGMRERAARIEAQLNLWSRPGAGTEIELRLSADAAYRPCLKKSRWKWMRRLLGDRN